MEERRKKETPKGRTPFGLKEEGDEVFGMVAKKLPPRVVAAADAAVVAVADVFVAAADVVVAAADAAVVAAFVAVVVAAAVAVVVAAGVVVVYVEAGRE